MFGQEEVPKASNSPVRIDYHGINGINSHCFPPAGYSFSETYRLAAIDGRILVISIQSPHATLVLFPSRSDNPLMMLVTRWGMVDYDRARGVVLMQRPDNLTGRGESLLCMFRYPIQRFLRMAEIMTGSPITWDSVHRKQEPCGLSDYCDYPDMVGRTQIDARMMHLWSCPLLTPVPHDYAAQLQATWDLFHQELIWYVGNHLTQI